MWSKDPSTQVGSIAVNDLGQTLSTGYNGFPRGVHDDERLNDRDLKYKIVVHAEANLVANAIQSLRGSTVYIWPFMPCSNCCGLLIQAGVSMIVSLKNDTERWQESFRLTEQLCKEAGVSLVIHDPEQFNMWRGDFDGQTS